MSHFTVMVRVPADVVYDRKGTGNPIENRVRQMLIPYKESGCGDEDPPELKQFLKFEDDEDEHLKKYAEETTEVFVDPAGALHCKYDSRFEKNPPGHFGISSETKYVCPDGWTAREAKMSELYPTFEGYMADYCGYSERDEETGRYGRWRNPNQKWDWYQIGGRWTGLIQLKAGALGFSGEPGLMTEANADPSKGDYCRIEDIDWDVVAAKTREAADKFWREWQRFCDGHEFKAFEGPRDKALSLGLLQCKNADELTGDEWKTIKWERQIKEGVDRFDVLTNLAREDFFAKYMEAFCPIKTRATLDEKGWNEPGKMGWWACSSDTPESYQAYAKGFVPWLRSGDQRDFVVVVDCHI